MPELPEVEVLARHLEPLLRNKRVTNVRVLHPRATRPDKAQTLVKALAGARLTSIQRRGKYLCFGFIPAGASKVERTLLGHLGMTGRMFLQPSGHPFPRHTAVAIELGKQTWIFEDARTFGRLTLRTSVLEELGPEPLSEEFSPEILARALKGSRQTIKVRLLDQGVCSGLGNIYATEALHLAEISPRRKAGRLNPVEVERLHRAIRAVLQQAIQLGSSIPLDFAGAERGSEDLFYFGESGRSGVVERFKVYDRAGLPCPRCGSPIRRIVQAGRSTFYCSHCQK